MRAPSPKAIDRVIHGTEIFRKIRPLLGAGQKHVIATHLCLRGTISPAQAIQLYGIYRLAAVVHELRPLMHIATEYSPRVNFKRETIYSLI